MKWQFVFPWTLCIAMGSMSILAGATPLDERQAIAASRAAIGSQPDPAIRFTTTEGRQVTLGDYRGKPLVVSFVYTACSQVCPATTRFLAKAVREARGVLGEGAFNVASIGFDIPMDNPMSMRVFAKQQGIDDRRWAFLTPEPGMPQRLAASFGFSYAATAGGYDHLTQVTVLDAEGRVFAQLYGESFALPLLVGPLKELALSGGPQAASAASVPRAEAGLSALERVRILCTVYDPVSGSYKLDYRLFIELATGASVAVLVLGFLLRERWRARGP